ncbi:hypothetical protein BKA62DRAFT_701810, partial [Auriculariales sp. MPI-PUGE-AT-0066]
PSICTGTRPSSLLSGSRTGHSRPEQGRRCSSSHCEKLHVPHLQRSGPYRHPIFQTIIQEQLFHQHERMAIDELTRGHFNPMPIGVLAIVATAVECALHDWSTGILERKGNTFTTDEWSGVYKKHVKALNTMKKIKPDMFAAWTRKLYMDCLETTKAYAALEESDDDEIQDEEMADYDDLDLRGFLPDPAVHASNT